ncbi:hypothetical protein [Caulobacter segnis]|nr:hypothetical protein [Caulobacter segnis]
MSPRIIALALIASLASLATASAAAPRACGHLQAAPAPANPKDVFRRAAWVCDMPADCMPHAVAGVDGASQPARSPR